MMLPKFGASAEMERVSLSRPCPVCKKPDWCLVAPDGQAAICSRVKSPKRSGEAGWLHRLSESVPPTSQKQVAARDWQAEATNFAARLDDSRRSKLAAHLNLPSDSLAVLSLLGYSSGTNQPFFTFPECDEHGIVIGLNRRFEDDSKRMMPGGRRGITLPNGWQDKPGQLLIVEGPTDTVALIAAGLCAIGRPSNVGGVSILEKLLRDLRTERAIVIVGENDRNEAGDWPGRMGAETTARQLAERLNRPVRWVLPPNDSKDVRIWLTNPERRETSWAQRGLELNSFLESNAVTINPQSDGVLTGQPHDDPDNPHRLADCFQVGTKDPLRYWRGDFLRWQNGAYRTFAEDDIRAELTGYVRKEFVALNLRDIETWDSQNKKSTTKPTTRKVSTRLLGDVMNALRGACMLPSSLNPPAWINGATGPQPFNLLPVLNGLLDVGVGRLLPASPDLFTLTCCPFEYSPGAALPHEWLRFLGTLWPGDPASVDTLQEWFGYLLAPDTRQQKILFLLGPKRSGKGTICRVLSAVVGENNVAGPTLGSLAMNFGLSPLLGKSVAIVSDARLSGRADVATITERLLSISGEDALTVDRKHRDQLTVKLSTRFVIASNELPRLGDASGALAGRLILLRITQSFFGSEDHWLLERLLVELPGILNWSLEGLRRLRKRGHFVQPPSGAELMADLEDLASPVGAFVRECCREEPGANVEVGKLYAAWRKWCEEHGRKEPGTEQTFGRDIRAVVSMVNIRRPKQGGERWREYVGIRLRAPHEANDTELAQNGSAGSAGSAALPNARDAKFRSNYGTMKNKEHEPRSVSAAVERDADLEDPRGPLPRRSDGA